MQRATPLEAVLRRDRAVVLGGLIGVAALAWAYTVYLAFDTGGMDMGTGGMAMGTSGMTMPRMQAWGGC